MIQQNVGHTGTENGTIMSDERNTQGAQITLERDTSTAAFAITCGIGGWLVHTRYLSSIEVAQSAYDVMKSELQRITDLITYSDSDEYVAKVVTELKGFVRRFP
ncbi:MAG: hypothetical protein ABI670_09235 [Chloroflexota bacterium]